MLEQFKMKGDRMPDWAFRFMALNFRVLEWFRSFDTRLDAFGIQAGDTVVDYGCGPGMYIKKAADLTGPEGKVYAADIHELAIRAVENKVRRLGLTNVETVCTAGYNSRIPDGCADVIYALDMFHMVQNPGALLKELRRIIKPEGTLILEDGHQPREKTLGKMAGADWEVAEETGGYIQCRPI